MTYHPAWIPYCNTISRDRAVYNTSSPYYAVFSYGDSWQKNTAAANPDIIPYLYRTRIGSKKMLSDVLSNPAQVFPVAEPGVKKYKSARLTQSELWHQYG